MYSNIIRYNELQKLGGLQPPSPSFVYTLVLNCCFPKSILMKGLLVCLFVFITPVEFTTMAANGGLKKARAQKPICELVN